MSYLKTTVSVDYFWLKQLYTESAEIIGIKYRFYKPRVINKRCCDLKQTHLCPKFFCDKNRTVWNYLRKWTANVSASFLGVQTFPCDFSSPFESITPRDLVLVFFFAEGTESWAFCSFIRLLWLLPETKTLY